MSSEAFRYFIVHVYCRVIANTLCLLAALLGPIWSYPYFQPEIPNGEGVPHPCKPNYIWWGVGHENQLGGGDRNPFGLDFQANNHQWTTELCRLDSDGDGRTNGEELGDPDCVWKRGDQPTASYNLSHPGICEPFDSPLCNGKPDFVSCDYDEFECEHTDEDTFNFTVRMPETPVPAEETTYMCLAFEFPTDKADPYHIIANEPYVNNANVMHHMTVYGICDVIEPPELNKPYPCGMGGQLSENSYSCMDLIAGWAVGSAGKCSPKEAGFLIGGDTGYRYAIIQYHWNNPQKTSDYTDSSGMTFYATPKLRPYNAGIFNTGQWMLEIPPGSDRHEEHGACSSKCTAMYMTGDIRIFMVNNHMHYLGRAQITQLNSQDGNTVYIGNDERYSYDSPVTHFHSEGIVVKPGDEISTKCVFQSTSRQLTTYFGESTAEEMCLSFFTFYPKENLRKRTCVQMYSIDECAINTGFVNGCDMDKLFNVSNPQTLQLITGIQTYCTVGRCRKECLDYAREVKSQPCFRGDVYKVVKRMAQYRTQEPVMLYAALDSCDVELFKEMLQDKEETEETNSASKLMTSLTVIPVLTFSVIYNIWLIISTQ